jgi:hypothetical protein
VNAESGPESRERARRRPITTICGEPLSVLEHPAVLATYTAPATVAELRENVTILEAGPRAARDAHWEQYGALVYGDGKDSFETEWP